jgi:hypothetical protein
MRTQKIHVLGSSHPNDPPKTPVYVDVEGDPDRDFYYLVGLRVRHEADWVQHSFWADNPASEEAMWKDTLGVLRVPWNNNNAEHSIKAFAGLRRTMGGASTVKGMEEYLVLLSISETCKARGGDTLGLFLAQ